MGGAVTAAYNIRPTGAIREHKMKKSSRRSAALIAQAAILFFSLASQSSFAIETQAFSAEVERGMQLWHVPGMAVAVVDSDEVIFQKGFGETAIDDGKAVDEHTLFAIASTTKAMVVAGILMLADEEKLQLDDLVIKHIPELHFADSSLTQQIRIRDLLAHRTGLPSTDLWVFMQMMPLDEQIRRLRTVESAASVRTRLIYQNTMFELAGLIIERVSGKRWDRFLTERLWQPIGMNETFGARGQITADKSHVMPHYFVDDQLRLAEWDLEKDHADAAGSVWSSIHDMSLWAQFLLRGAVTDDGRQLVTEEGVAQMFEPQQLATPDDFYPTVELTKPNWRSYGLGWFQQDFQGRKIEFHTGSLSGLIAIIGLDRAAGKALIVLGNRDHAEMRHALLWHVMDDGVSSEKRDWNQDIYDLYETAREESHAEQDKLRKSRIRGTKPGLSLDEYAGTFNSDIVGEFKVRKEKRKLILESANISFELSHWHLDVFEIKKAEWDFQAFATFGIGPDGVVDKLHVFGMDLTRVPDETAEGD